MIPGESGVAGDPFAAPFLPPCLHAFVPMYFGACVPGFSF